MTDLRPTHRQHLRKPLRTSALLSSTALPTLTVRTLDLSLGGMGIVAPANLIMRVRCTVLLAILNRTYGSTQLRLEAAVAHCVFAGAEDGFKIGLQFTLLSAEAEAAIAQYLQSR